MGALASIKSIYLEGNEATEPGKQAIREVAKARGFVAYV